MKKRTCVPFYTKQMQRAVALAAHLNREADVSRPNRAAALRDKATAILLRVRAVLFAQLRHPFRARPAVPYRPPIVRVNGVVVVNYARHGALL